MEPAQCTAGSLQPKRDLCKQFLRCPWLGEREEAACESWVGNAAAAERIGLLKNGSVRLFLRRLYPCTVLVLRPSRSHCLSLAWNGGRIRPRTGRHGSQAEVWPWLGVIS